MEQDKSNRETTLSTTAPDLTFKRLFDASRDLVFRMWTDPKHLSQWWGPDDFSNPRCEVDARVGGKVSIDMRGPDGTVYPNRGEIREIVPPERLVFTLDLHDDNGRTLISTLVTITLAEKKGKTEMTANTKVVDFAPEAALYLAGMEEGWKQMLDRLEKHTTNHR